MPISRRPVESKRRATRLWKDLGGILPDKAATVVIRAALVKEETGSAFHPKGACYTLTPTRSYTVHGAAHSSLLQIDTGNRLMPLVIS